MHDAQTLQITSYASHDISICEPLFLKKNCPSHKKNATCQCNLNLGSNFCEFFFTIQKNVDMRAFAFSIVFLASLKVH
jgi:hypothetical protein